MCIAYDRPPPNLANRITADAPTITRYTPSAEYPRISASCGRRSARRVCQPVSETRLTSGISAGVTYGLLAALVTGLGVGNTLCLTAGRYGTASVLFACTDVLPARPARFFEWARNAGLLRVTGVAYQIRHDTYQEWLLLTTYPFTSKV
jgi:hypothetical protein